MPALMREGWELLGCGAYFAYLRHPFAMPAPYLAPKLLQETGVLLLPGTMFMPAGDPAGERHVRVAFANVDRTGINDLFARLTGLGWPLAPVGDSA